MKKARGKAAAKHMAAKAAAKAAANSTVETVSVAANATVETVAEAANTAVEEVKEISVPVEEKIEVKPEITVQYRHYECDMDEIVKRVKENYEVKGNRGVEIEKIQIYVKPEDFAAYYVINDGFAGKVNLF